jgi:hypothetical protein
MGKLLYGSLKNVAVEVAGKNGKKQAERVEFEPTK